MSLHIEDTGCCAVDEICHLSHEPDAKTAMKNFCRQFGPGSERFYNDRHQSKRGLNNIPGHIIFTGVIKHKDGSRVSGTPEYGQKFATYIRRHKLGSLIESYEGNNRVNHPGHMVKVWVWTPSVNKVKKWWKLNMNEKDKNDWKEYLDETREDNLFNHSYGYGYRH